MSLLNEFPIISPDQNTSAPDAGSGGHSTHRGNHSWRQRVGEALWLLLFAAIPAAAVHLSPPTPQVRHIHIEAFRYGKDPSVIRCNLGDTLHLTFSTRDTGHSFFLDEFGIDAKITPATDKVTVFNTRAPQEPPSIQKEVVLEARHTGWLGCLVSKSHYRCHVWCGPMHAFEHGNLVIWPNTLLAAGLGLLLGLPMVGLIRIRAALRSPGGELPDTALPESWDLFQRFPWLKRLLKWREFPLIWIVIAGAGLYLVILTSVFGTHVAGRNFGVMMVWVVWMFLLTAVLTPLGGRIWCMACPLPVIGDVIQRHTLVGIGKGSTNAYHNQFFGLNLAWPTWLANDWPRFVSFLGFGTFSAALVAYPKFSGWAILGLVVLAALLAPIFELRSFCRYLCPVTGFIGLYARNAKVALRVADPNVCSNCKVHTCQLGSAKGWACPFGLCAAEIHENNDCGMCTECLRTCAYDNVTLKWRPFASEIKIRSAGEAWLAMGMLVLATTYSFVHLGHWPFLRDCVNIMDKGNWDLFALFGASLWLVTLVLVPGLLLLTAAVARRLSGSEYSTFALMKQSTGALIPLGLGVWVAFVTPMLTANVTFVLQSLSDPFGWGWNLLGAAGSEWHPMLPRAMPWIQVGLVLLGLRYGLRNGWRIWQELAPAPRAALRGTLPVAILLIVYTGCMVWFYAN